MLGHDDVAELMKIEPVSVCNDVASAVTVDDAFLALCSIHTQSADLHRFNAIDQCLGIDQASAGTIHQDHSFFHFCNALMVDHMVGGRKQRHMKRDDITLPIQRVQIDILRHLCHLRILINIVCQNAAAKAP